MKFVVAFASALILLASGAHVSAVGEDTGRANQARPALHAARNVSAGAATLRLGSDYVGKDVINSQGEALGEIIDLAIDGAQGRVIYAVMGSGGFLGIGQELHAVPLRAFDNVAADDGLLLEVSKARLDAQPGFDADHWPANANDQLVAPPAVGTSTSRSLRRQAPATTNSRGENIR